MYQTSHDEGRIVNDVYEYNITDHLGNTRISFKDNQGVPEVTQINHVGAWGETLESLSYVNTSKINNFTLSTYEKENDFGIGVFDAHARVYDAITPRMWQQDVMTEKYFELNPYNYVANNPILLMDPDGRDWFRHDDTRALIWRDSQVGSISVNDQTFNNVGARYAWTSSISNGNGGTQTVLNIGATDGTTSLITPNEHDVVQFPESGNGFARYTNNDNDASIYLENRLTPQGDNWMNPATAAAFYNTIQQFNRQEPGVTVHYGDASSSDPANVNLGHRTHTQGRAIDIHYMGASGQELTGNTAYSNADVCITNCFMGKAEANGFSNNYTYGSRFTHSGNNNHNIHKNHLHIGQPNRR